MRQHHTKIHGKPLPNRICNGCGEEFYDSKARKSYCLECNPNAGPNNGNWSDALETTNCRLCDREFEYYPSNKLGVYCTKCVNSSEGLLPENPSSKVPRVTVHCKFCKSLLSRRPNQVSKSSYGSFCDIHCYGRWLSNNIVGPEHHQWDGGPRTYSGSWWSVREMALKRDDYACRLCGLDVDQLGRNPDVHHLVPVRAFENEQDAHVLGNVVSLCRSCHRNVEEGNLPAPSNEK